MSNYIVGLDFGTHQSKVCIEDSSNQWQLTYEFLEFPGIPKGEQKVLLPSVVQINKDETVSYGYVDPGNAMVVANEGSTPPKKEIIPEPKYYPIPAEPLYEELPTKPASKYKGPFAILSKLLPESEEEKKWRQLCSSTERKNENERIAWIRRKQEIIAKNEELRKEYEKQVEEAENQYQLAYDEWREDQQHCTQMRFRYFKQATFFDRSIWTNNFISPEDASIWYLAYIRFLLNKKLGTDYIVRMGVPCSYQDITSFRQHAYNLWAGAGRLVEHYQDIDAFLSADYNDLRKYGQYKEVKLKGEDPFGVRTEAQASLFAVVSNKRILTPINLLFDIGGGTTDIAVFQITPEKELKILETISVPKGLNYIFEEYQKQNSGATIEKIHEKFAANPYNEEYGIYINKYIEEIEKASFTLSSLLTKSLLQSKWVNTRGQVIDALQNNPSVFCGGGSAFDSMRNVTTKMLGRTGQKNDKVQIFKAHRVVNQSLLGINNVQNKGFSPNIYQILSAAYGLSLMSNWYEVPSDNIMKTFQPGPNEEQLPTTTVPERNDEAIK